jgi:hypothetical protein
MIRIRVEDDMPEGFEEAFRSALAGVRTSNVMAEVEQIILDRTQSGEFLEGSSPGAESYSTKSYAQPAGSLTDQVREDLPGDETSYFTTSEDALWLVVEGGYEAIRRAKGLPTDHVDLTRSGDMLKGLRSIAFENLESGQLQMLTGYIKGVSPQEATQIARYHNVEGAGKNEMKRVFVGLTEEEAEDILDDLEDDVTRNL